MNRQHPASLDLEAFACGEQNDSVAEHIASCDACKAFTSDLEAAQRAFAEETDVDAVIEAAVSAAGKHDAPIRPIRPMTAALRILPFIAMAAGVLLWMRMSATTPDLRGPTPPTTAATNGATTSPANENTTGTAFKGGTQLAVIRERDGVQKRFTTEVSVRKGDRLRIEVALDRSSNIIAGVLADDGTFLDLLHEGQRGTGTFYSEEAARFDDSPTRGYVIVGTADAVAKARAAGPSSIQTAGNVTLMRVVWEGP